MTPSFSDFFTDPVLRAPTIGSMLMCVSASLVGVIVFIRKRSLLGEALSHAAYPGVVISTALAPLFLAYSEEALSAVVLVGAFAAALAGLWCIEFLERKGRVSSDAALCFVLSIFFGVGVLIGSHVQSTRPLWYKQIQVFLYGQAATMMEGHILLYGALTLLTLLVIICLFRPIEVLSFDRGFAKSVGIDARLLDACTFLLLVLAIVIGIRSVGVVLMSGMLIAPAAAARQWTHRLAPLFTLSAAFGLLSGFCGNYLSARLSTSALPTGPTILLSAAAVCFLSLLSAPQKGLASRAVRVMRFRHQVLSENLLKACWRKGESSSLSYKEISACQRLPRWLLRAVIWRLTAQGWVERAGKKRLRLTPDGWRRASRIVRLHRLWEVYLVDYLGQGAEKVHRSAEEMEHILTPELEQELAELLHHPRRDPHHQPIPGDA